MTDAIRRMAVMVRREAVAWLFLGFTLRWVWIHGLDRWTLLFFLLAAGIHPKKGWREMF